MQLAFSAWLTLGFLFLWSSFVAQASKRSQELDTDLKRLQARPESSVSNRPKRDGYGGGYSGGYGSGGGSYGCYCPYQSCDNSGDMLLYFSAGALLGLLFSMLQPQLMVPVPPVTNGVKRQLDDSSTVYQLLTSLPAVLHKDLGPVALEMAHVYYKSQMEPQCANRWLCEVNQRSSKQGGIKAHLTSLSSFAIGWFLADPNPFLEAYTTAADKDPQQFDCSLLAPQCHSAFQ